MNVRHGPVPAGRKMFDIKLNELERFAADNKLHFHHLGCVPDALGRKDVSWDNIALHFPR
jgi:hypothetical protein